VSAPDYNDLGFTESSPHDDLGFVPSPPQPSKSVGDHLRDAGNYLKNDFGEFVKKGDAFANGALNGASLGFADEIGGALKGAYDRVTGKSNNLPQAYRAERDNLRQDLRQSANEHPLANALGNITGGAMGAAATGGLGAGLKGAALLGGVAGLGNSNHDLTTGDPSQYAKAGIDTVVGAGAGVAGYGAAKGLQAAGNTLPMALRNFSERRAVKATGAIKSDLSGMRPDQIQSLGRSLLDKGLIKVGATPEKTMELVDAARQEQGQRIGDLMDTVDSLGGGKAFNATQFASRVRNGLLKDVRQNPALQSVAESPIEGLLANIENGNGTRKMSFPQANEFESTMSKGLYNKLDPAPKIETMKKLRDILNDEINSQASKISPGIGQHLAEADANYGPLAQASKIGDKAMQRQIGNRYFSPSDHWVGGLGGAAGLATHDPKMALLGLSAGFGNKLLRERGPSTLAVGADKLADLASMPASSKIGSVLTRALNPVSSGMIPAEAMSEQLAPRLEPLLSDDDIKQRARIASLRGQ
jgi:hypothetical protein